MIVCAIVSLALFLIIRRRKQKSTTGDQFLNEANDNELFQGKGEIDEGSQPQGIQFNINMDDEWGEAGDSLWAVNGADENEGAETGDLWGE
jgi:hypothetical protein